MYEEYAYVFEINKTFAKVIGESYFTPLELVIKKEVSVEPGERLYIGKDKRDKVYSIRRKLNSKDIIDSDILESTIRKIIREKPNRFIEFVNNSKAITMQKHQLHLIPNVGEKKFKKYIKYLDRKKFESIEEIQREADYDFVKNIARRIILELIEDKSIKLFVNK